jgi:hypothetical protein
MPPKEPQEGGAGEHPSLPTARALRSRGAAAFAAANQQIEQAAAIFERDRAAARQAKGKAREAPADAKEQAYGASNQQQAVDAPVLGAALLPTRPIQRDRPRRTIAATNRRKTMARVLQDRRTTLNIGEKRMVGGLNTQCPRSATLRRQGSF